MAKDVVWVNAQDVRNKAESLVKEGNFLWLDTERIFFVRSYGARTRASARIWGLPRIWQTVLNIKPYYIIEVVGERYDKLSDSKKNDVLIHEFAHIPRNFSGALVPHFKRGRRKFSDIVEVLKSRCFKRR